MRALLPCALLFSVIFRVFDQKINSHSDKIPKPRYGRQNTELPARFDAKLVLVNGIEKVEAPCFFAKTGFFHYPQESLNRNACAFYIEHAFNTEFGGTQKFKNCRIQRTWKQMIPRQS